MSKLLLFTISSLFMVQAHAATESYPARCFKASISLDSNSIPVGKICTTEQKVKAEANNGDFSGEFESGVFTIKIKDLRGKVRASYVMKNKVYLGPGAGIDQTVYSSERWTANTNSSSVVDFVIYDDDPKDLSSLYGTVTISGQKFNIVGEK